MDKMTERKFEPSRHEILTQLDFIITRYLNGDECLYLRKIIREAIALLSQPAPEPPSVSRETVREIVLASQLRSIESEGYPGELDEKVADVVALLAAEEITVREEPKE